MSSGFKPKMKAVGRSPTQPVRRSAINNGTTTHDSQNNVTAPDAEGPTNDSIRRPAKLATANSVSQPTKCSSDIIGRPDTHGRLEIKITARAIAMDQGVDRTGTIDRQATGPQRTTNSV